MEIEEISKIVGKYLKTSGYNVPYIEYSQKIQEFFSWYRGKTSWHDYFVNTGTGRVGQTRASLNMAKTCCEDMASLLMNERVSISMSDNESQVFIDRVLENNNFRVNANQLIELMCALGTCAYVESIYNKNGENVISIDYIHGDMIFPLTWENGIITECAFGKIRKENSKFIYTLLIHEVGENGTYIIRTVDIDGKGMEIPKPSELGSDGEEGDIIETGSYIPLFQVVKPNIVNNYDKTCPLGISIYGNAIDILKNIDVKYDSWRNEFETGKRKIFIKSGLYSVTFKPFDGTVTPVVDPTDTIFYQIEWTKDDIPIHEFSPTLRDTDHSSSIDSELKLFSRKVGLGDSFYAFNGGAVARTATEVVSTNSALFRNLDKHELVLRSAIVLMCKALLNLENIYNGGNYDIDQDITINFDDSIIEDSEKEQSKAMLEFNSGLIDRVEYFVLTRKMTRAQALKFVAEMDGTSTMKATQSFLNSEQFGGFGQ